MLTADRFPDAEEAVVRVPVSHARQRVQRLAGRPGGLAGRGRCDARRDPIGPAGGALTTAATTTPPPTAATSVRRTVTRIQLDEVGTPEV
jgi:hypothetical protein